MSEVLVFVDDAVLGRLPAVCAKDGVPTEDRLRTRADVGDRAGMGVAWVLLLLGPLGWVGLLILHAMRGGPDVLAVELPLGEDAYQRLRAARRLRRNAFVAGVLGGAVAVSALVSSSGTGPWAALAALAGAFVVASIVTLVVADGRVRRALVGISLDASRRWVTLSRVHPHFVAACAAQQRDRQHR